ncbi:hypothetical protein JTE90_010793 [Oedothorax gibbosus]|uniref:Uncharacterized protein n=1 Tax=Oedothorax gibbosus TaxID=931172 RepID=A0AAV6VHY8_9ARAC|nr:hypothetical protein JTE90_010793 [Oedothorax gibbosus]
MSGFSSASLSRFLKNMNLLGAVTIVFLICAVGNSISDADEQRRKLPLNGSIFGKRFDREFDVEVGSNDDFRRNMKVAHRGTDESRRPQSSTCDWIFEACHEWYVINSQDRAST